MECVVCLEANIEKIKLFQCDHENFHRKCIINLRKCPLCRAGLLVNNNEELINKIYIWHENQRLPALNFRDSKYPNAQIILINSTYRLDRTNSIFYHHT